MSEKVLPKQAPNEFEFLRSMPFGPYLPVDSPIHRLDPRTRILLFVLLMASLLAARQIPGLLLAFAVPLLLYRLAAVPYRPLSRGWRNAIPLFLFLVIFQLISSSHSATDQALLTIGFVTIWRSTLWVALALIIRFAGLMAVIGLGTATISESELTRGLESLLSPLKVIKIPVTDFVMIVQVTLRYFPLLAQTAERIAKAQASRGADWHPTGWNILKRVRQIFPLIVPLFVASLRRAENMALAMDARGYGSLPARSSMVSLRYHLADGLTLLLCLLVLTLSIIL